MVRVPSETRSRRGVWFARLGLAAVMVAGLARPSTADVIIGATNSNNSFPVGSPAYSGEYQQVYASSAFPGLVSINSISFETIPGFGNPTTPQSVTFSLSLSTTSAAPGALSTTYSANRGADFTSVFSGTFTYTPQSNNTFDFVVPTSIFSYNPGLGNLLVDINVTTPAGTGVVFAAGTTDARTSRVFNNGGMGAATADALGLLTRIGTGPAGPSAPEPSSLVLAGVGGVLALGFRRWRRRKGASPGF